MRHAFDPHVTEAGGVVRRFDRTPYRAVDMHKTGLLVASDSDTWNALHTRLFESSGALGSRG